MAFWKSGVAEISGLGGGGMAVHEFGDAGENQHRGELRRQHIGLTDAKISKLKLIEFAWGR